MKLSELVRQVFLSLLERRRPLLQVGGALFLVFFVYHYVIEKAQFAPLASDATLTILTGIVDYVFYLAIFVCALSFLAYILPKLIPESVLTPVQKVKHGLTIVRLFNPLEESPIARIMARTEPYIGFPYYSRESDHPGSWPPRVMRDRDELYEHNVALYVDPAVAKRVDAARGVAGDESSLEILTSAPQFDDDEARRERANNERIAASRLFLNQVLEKGGEKRLAKAVGNELARDHLALEKHRQNEIFKLPNRLAVLRLHNTAKKTLENLVVEFEVAGALYDLVVSGEEGDHEKPDWSIFANRIEVERFPPDVVLEVRVWYWYQELASKGFPDKIDLIWEACQGLRLSNLSVDDGRVEFDESLVSGIDAYERLYLGDGRKKDNYEEEITDIMNANAAEMEEHMAEYQAEHLTLKDLDPAELAELDINDDQVDNVWLSFRSPAGRDYSGVCVYEHTNGPYILLSSKDRDPEDLTKIQQIMAKLLESEPDEEISERSDDICLVVRAPAGFSIKRVHSLALSLTEQGCKQVRVAKLHYRRTRPGAG